MRAISISPARLEGALKKLPRALEKYAWIQTELSKRDVSKDREFQKRFSGFYRVRRNATWRAAYFGLLQTAKKSPISFAEALRRLHIATGRVEASFASKLVATVDPKQPVIDSVVVRNLGLKMPKAHAADRLEQLADVHQQLASAYAAYLASEPGREVVARFAGRYPRPKLSRVKRLDLVLWQMRG